MSFEVVSEFEKKIANFFGSKYAVAVDCCTHALELCLIYNKTKYISVPHRTYISVPLLSHKLNLEWEWKTEEWEDYYQLGESNIYDAAVLWKKNSYLPDTFMCLSFQFRKHLNLGRGGMILTDSKIAKKQLIKMAYDGRERNDISWSVQNINTIGYHYYMTPETARKGLERLPEAIKKNPKKWVHGDWPDLRKMDIFKK